MRTRLILLFLAVLLALAALAVVGAQAADGDNTVYLPMIENDTWNCPPGTIRSGEGCVGMGPPPLPPTPTPTPAPEPVPDAEGRIRLIDPAADHYAWCELQGIACYEMALDPGYKITAPEGFRIWAVTILAKRDDGLNSQRTWIRWYGRKCSIEGDYCIDTDGVQLEAWRELAAAPAITVSDIRLERAP